MNNFDLYAMYKIKREDNCKGYLHFAGGVGTVSIIICPGGGYEYLSDTEKYNVAKTFIEQGFRAYVLEYSVAPIKYPNSYLELSLSIDFINKIDKGNKVAVLGFSAGGHLVGMGATLHNKDFALDKLKEIRVNLLDMKIKPDIAIMCYPVVSTRLLLKHKGSFKNLCGNDKGLEKMLSLETQVDKETSPTFLWHTKQDRGVSYKNSVLFYNTLQNNNIESKLLLFKKGGHGLSMGNDEFPEISNWVTKCIDFITQISKK